jgi:hypothetical protein
MNPLCSGHYIFRAAPSDECDSIHEATLSLSSDGTFRYATSGEDSTEVSKPPLVGWWYLLDENTLKLVTAELQIGTRPESWTHANYAEAGPWLRIEEGVPICPTSGAPMEHRIAGEDVELTPETGLTDLHKACMGIDSSPSEEGDWAARFERSLKRLRQAISGSTEFSAPTRTGGLTPLHLAVSMGSHDHAIALIKAGANCKAVDARGWSPLHHMWTTSLSTYTNMDSMRTLFALMRDGGVRADTPGADGRTAWDLWSSPGFTRDNLRLLKSMEKHFKLKLSEEQHRATQGVDTRSDAQRGGDQERRRSTWSDRN